MIELNKVSLINDGENPMVGGDTGPRTKKRRKICLEGADLGLEEVRDMACSSSADDEMAGVIVALEVETKS